MRRSLFFAIKFQVFATLSEKKKINKPWRKGFTVSL